MLLCLFILFIATFLNIFFPKALKIISNVYYIYLWIIKAHAGRKLLSVGWLFSGFAPIFNFRVKIQQNIRNRIYLLHLTHGKNDPKTNVR